MVGVGRKKNAKAIVCYDSSREYLIEAGDVDIFPHVLSEFVVLLLLEIGVAEVIGCGLLAIGF